MEKINLQDVKRLSAKLTGKEKPKSRHAEKLQKVRQRMSLKYGSRIRNANELPGLESPSYLFYYKGQYYHVQGEFKKVSAADVENLLSETPETQIYFLCADNICPMPDVLRDKDKTGKKVKDDAEAVRFISEKAGITFTVNNL